MNSDRERQITGIFNSAIERKPDERALYLDGACGTDESLRQEVEALINSHESAGSFIDSPAYERGADLLSTERAGALVGRSFGQYRLVSLLGAGGMGEVYLAEDTRLDRRVALKVLPLHLTADLSQVGRFQQEARAASALNHPNIVTIHEINEAEGTHYIATEYIEGMTLRTRLGRSGLTLGEALDIAVQVASALNAAHSAGVVHRDIKPENVMLRPDGYVKVLDFGIAKLMERQRPVPDAEAATRALVQTGKGVVMGTSHYMSPEQARGVPVDVRTDIWSLGVVLYEMVAGHVPFTGETASDCIASILKTSPAPLTNVVQDAPEALEWIVTKALTKDKEERYQTAREFLTDLRRLKQRVERGEGSDSVSASALTGDSGTTGGSGQRVPATAVAAEAITGAATGPGTVSPTHTTSSAEYIATGIRQHKLGAALTLTVIAVVVVGVAFAFNKYTGRKNATSLIFQNAEVSRVTTSGRASNADISPDGKFIVYLEMADDGNRSIMVRQTATGNTLTIVPPTKGNVLKKTSFSRDGNFVYYLFSDRTKPEALYQVASIGGVPKKLIDDCDSPAAVSPDGKKIAFVRGRDRKSNLIVANADGTGERVVASLQEDRFFEDDGLSWSPDAKTIACVAIATVGDEESCKLVGVDSETGAIRELSGKRWARLCRMVWMPDGASLAIIAMERIEEGRLQVWRISYPGGEASRITNDTQDRDFTSLGVTADGRTLICVTEEHLSRIETISASGDISRATQLSLGEANQDGFDGITQTPDGRIIFASFEGTQADLWVMNADGTNRKRLTSDSYWDGEPVVSPDGRYIVFASNRPIGGISSRLWRMDIDGSNLKQLTTRYAFAPSVSPDGRWVVFASVTPSEGTKLAKISIDGGDPVPVTDYNATNPCYSPDGQWIACFALDDKATGRQYFGQAASNSWEYSTIPATGGRPVKQFDFPAFQYQHIAWTPDSRYVSFIGTPPDPSNIWLQPIAGGEAHRLTNFKSDYIFQHSWSPDGRSLVLVRGREAADVVLMKDTREGVRP